MVKQGYKQTEIGVIPEDWEVSIFEDFADKTKKWSITGGPFGSNLKTDDYTNEGVQIVQLQNIGDGSFNNSSQIFTSNKKADELLSCNIYPGEIILSKMGDPVARACYIPNEFPRYLMASDGIRLVVNEKKYSKEFVFQYINSPFFRNRAIEISTGSTRQRIGLPELKSLKVILPPLAEQEAIASALSDADAWIDRLEQLIAKRRLIKQGAMQTLLTPPSHAEALEAWEVKKLGEMVSLITKGTTPTSVGFDFTESGINFIKVESITKNGQIEKDKIAFISERCNDVLSRSQIKENDILFSIAGALGRVAIVKKEIVPANTNQALGIIRLKENTISKEFLYYFFNTSEFQQMLNTISVTGAQPNLSLQNLNEFDISFPSLSEQERIATILSDMDAELEALETQLGKARQIKQGMMQELLTGRTRLV